MRAAAGEERKVPGREGEDGTATQVDLGLPCHGEAEPGDMSGVGPVCRPVVFDDPQGGVHTTEAKCADNVIQEVHAPRIMDARTKIEDS